MTKKIKSSLVIFSFLLCLTALSSAFADDDGGEGYSPVTLREFSRTLISLGGVDINDPEVADEYAKLAYCGLYKKAFNNDLEWYRIRSKIISRVSERKEYFRVLYEMVSVFKLGRYDIDGQSFPLSPDTAMVNVGSILVLSIADFKGSCGNLRPSDALPVNMRLVLDKPLTLNAFRIPMGEVKNIQAGMTKANNPDRTLYGRIRFRILDAPGMVTVDKNWEAALHAEVRAIDFFLDKEMTKAAGKTQLAQ